MILGMSWIRSSELSRPAVLTAEVAASTTRVICALVSEFDRVFPERLSESVRLLNPGWEDLVLLVVVRLLWSSLMTEEARAVLVSGATGALGKSGATGALGKSGSTGALGKELVSPLEPPLEPPPEDLHPPTRASMSNTDVRR
jgi:hypothetical protein